MARFYGHFAAAYGTFWLIIVVAAVVSQSHVDAGAFGLCGFPVIALVYALVRTGAAPAHAAEVARLRERVRELEWDLANRPPP